MAPEEEKPLLTESQEEGGGSGPGGQAPQTGTTSQANTRVLFKTHWVVEAGLRTLVLVTYNSLKLGQHRRAQGGRTTMS